MLFLSLFSSSFSHHFSLISRSAPSLSFSVSLHFFLISASLSLFPPSLSFFVYSLFLSLSVPLWWKRVSGLLLHDGDCNFVWNFHLSLNNKIVYFFFFSKVNESIPTSSFFLFNHEFFSFICVMVLAKTNPIQVGSEQLKSF